MNDLIQAAHDPENRCAALTVLADTCDPQAAAEIRRHLKDTSAQIRLHAACLLTEEELAIRNVPRIRDVESMLALLERLGVKVEWKGDNELSLRADSVAGCLPRPCGARRGAVAKS